MTDTVIRDHTAGLQFRLPTGWSLDIGDLMGPFTAIASRPRPVVDPDDREHVARVIAEEQRLWEVATDPSQQETESRGFEAPSDDHVSVALGVFEGTDGGPDDPPTAGELLGIADWLAATNAALIGLYPEGPLQSEARDQRVFAVGGCPAAEITYAFVAARATGYQRVVVIAQSDGQTSFAVGVATQPTDQAVVGKVLDTVTPLP